MIVLYLAGEPGFSLAPPHSGRTILRGFCEGWEAIRLHHGLCHTFLGEAGPVKLNEWQVLKIRPPAA